MTEKLTIAAAGNTEVPAFLVLEAKGYAVSRSLTGEKETWIAESDKVELIADSPLALLGLAALVEARGEKWQASDAEIKRFLRDFAVD